MPWEYCVDELPASNKAAEQVQAYLNARGQEDWELISFSIEKMEHGTSYHPQQITTVRRFYWKRPTKK